jgi:TonB family protein
MKLVLSIILFAFCVLVCAQTFEKTSYVNLNCKEQPLRLVLAEIRTQTGIDFVYRDKLVNNIKITCRINNDAVEDAIKKILNEHNLACQAFDRNSYVLFKEKTPAEKYRRAAVIKESEPEKKYMPTTTSPIMMTRFEPIYPLEAVRKNIEGRVIVKLLINKEGNVSNIKIQRSSNYAILDSAAIDYSKRLNFIPAQTNGKPQDTWMSLVLRYCFVDN